MKKFLLCCFAGAFLASCNSGSTTDASTTKDSTVATTTTTTDKPMVDLPYKASYSSSFSTDVSDADLKTVLQSYKDWADGNMANTAKAYGDTLEWDQTTGNHHKAPNADIMKLWSTYRDSLSSVTLDMEAWQKLFSTDKKDGFVITWYKEIDTYKNVKADSAYYSDINQVKNGKIVWLSQYKRPAK